MPGPSEMLRLPALPAACKHPHTKVTTQTNEPTRVGPRRDQRGTHVHDSVRDPSRHGVVERARRAGHHGAAGRSDGVEPRAAADRGQVEEAAGALWVQQLLHPAATHAERAQLLDLCAPSAPPQLSPLPRRHESPGRAKRTSCILKRPMSSWLAASSRVWQACSAPRVRQRRWTGCSCRLRSSDASRMSSCGRRSFRLARPPPASVPVRPAAPLWSWVFPLHAERGWQHRHARTHARPTRPLRHHPGCAARTRL
jgi:hypothetical protein